MINLGFRLPSSDEEMAKIEKSLERLERKIIEFKAAIKSKAPHPYPPRRMPRS